MSSASERNRNLRCASPDPAATGAAALEEGGERPQRVVVPLDRAEEAAGIDVVEAVRVAEQHEHGLVGTKAGAHRLFDGCHGGVETVGCQQVDAELVDLGGEDVVVASHLDELPELTLEPDFLLPQHGYLAFDE